MSAAPKSEQAITDFAANLAAAMEAAENDPINWTPPWRSTSHVPYNATTGNAYRGMNILMLWATGRGEPGWATYNQWTAAGWQVRSGETGTTLVKWTVIHTCKADGCTHRTAKGPCQAHREQRSSFMSPSAFTVFNGHQVAKIVGTETYTDAKGREKTRNITDDTQSFETPIPDVIDHDPVDEADAYFAATGADIRNGLGRAYFNPSSDYVSLPPLGDFHTADGYYATLAHEMTHWTGHKSRLDRRAAITRFGDEAYAFEELVAEIGSAFLCARLGIANVDGIRDDHVTYLRAWVRVLTDQPKAIMSAASQAQKAVDLLDSFQQPAASDTDTMEVAA